MKQSGSLPEVVCELVGQLEREKNALHEQSRIKGEMLRCETDLETAAIQSEADEKIRLLREKTAQAQRAIQNKAQQEIKLRIEETIERLVQWQTHFTEEKQVSEAAAVAEEVRRWRGHRAEEPKPGPQNLEGLRDHIGESFIYETTGTIDGPLWGTDTYTSDSCLGKAAVHAGILRAGETGVVCVTIVECLPNYKGTTRHGITSSPWADPWHGAYRVERA